MKLKLILITLLLPLVGLAQTRQTGGISFTPQWNFKISGSDTTWQFGNTLMSPNQFPYFLTKWQSDQRYGKNSTFINIKDLGGLGDGTTNQTTLINTAIVNNKFGEIYFPKGVYIVDSLVNKYGVKITGPGVIAKTGTSGTQQLNSGMDNSMYEFGQEYLAFFQKKILAGSTIKIIYSGDSTTEGTAATPDYKLQNLTSYVLDRKGISNVTVTNAGATGATTADWLSTYMPIDTAAHPDLYIVRWGINLETTGNPTTSLTQFETNLRAGLTQIRARYTQAQMSILLMSTNSTSDNPNFRNEDREEKIRQIYRRAARDFQCGFIDTYALWLDSRNGAANLFMDDPYSNGISIHPLDIMNTWIVSKIYNFIIPPVLELKASLNTKAKGFEATGSLPYYGLINTSAGTDMKVTDTRVASDGIIRHVVVNDARTTFTQYMSVTRYLADSAKVGFAFSPDVPTANSADSTTKAASTRFVKRALYGLQHPWASITGKPTTISGYGITDFNSLGDARWLNSTTGGVVNDNVAVSKNVAGSAGFTAQNFNAAGYSTFTFNNSGTLGKIFDIGVGGNAAAGGVANRFYMFNVSTSSLVYDIDQANKLTYNGAIETSGLDNYTTDLSGSYTSRSKVDKAYVDAAVATSFVSGTYTPTITNGTNISSTTAQVCNYYRVGNMVTVSGAFFVTDVAGSTFSTLHISLPIASNLGTFSDLSGFGSKYASGGSNITNIYIDAESSGGSADTAELSFLSGSSAGTNTVAFSFTYRVI